MTDYAPRIEAVFKEFKLDAKVVNAVRGPRVTRYELALGPGVRVEKVIGLRENLAYALACDSVRLALVPGKSAVGVELPSTDQESVTLSDVLAKAGNNPLTVAVGKDLEGGLITSDLSAMPHLLVAGTTGSGKSTFINAALVSLLKRATPDQVQLVLIDPKQVELTPYEGVAHLARPVVTETDDAIKTLAWLVDVMQDRYSAMKDAKVRHISGLPGYPYIVCVVDELADLMLASTKEVEPLIVRLAQKGRAAGMHLVLATQRPSVDVVTGLIKANCPSRLAFASSSAIDSRVVLDEAGAEQLLGMGDALYKPIGSRAAVRVQGAYVSDAEVAAAVKAATPVVRNARKAAPERRDLDAVMLDELISYTGDAIERVDGYLKLLNNPRVKQDDKMMAYYDLPIELGAAGIALDEIAHRLRRMKESVDTYA